MQNSNQNQSEVNLLRTFWRTMALQLLLVVLFIVFRQMLQEHSVLSLAANTTRVSTADLVNGALIKDLAIFIGTVLLVHFIWGGIIVVSCIPFFSRFENSDIRSLVWGTLFLLHLTLIISINSFFFPTSLLGYFRHTPLVEPVFITVLSILLIFLFLYGVKRVHYVLVIFLLLASSYAMYDFSTQEAGQQQNLDSPNVILIGVDGLRPDHLSGSFNRGMTPAIDNLMSKSTVYDRVYTPQGRTFVAWTSILTGMYPKNHKARFNLSSPDRVERPFRFIKMLREKGYFTNYAIDERRFNQIDKTYGFDNTVGPKIGAADGIISNFADFPLVNLLLKVPIARSLFPYLYLNRGYGKGYSAEDFNSAVIESLSLEKPNFLAVHFCQLHWPFTSPNFIEPSHHEWSGNYNHYMYSNMLGKVDEQVSSMLSGLQKRGLLNNAILIFLSDHGEGFKLERDRLAYAGEGVAPKLNLAAWGHGTNVASQEQAHVVLSVARYRNGKAVSEGSKVKGLFSLVDIIPTLISNLDIDISLSKLDGEVLPKESSEVNSDRHVFVESSLPVRSVNASFIDETKVMSEAGSYFKVNDDGRAVIKDEVYDELVARKQRSIYYKNWQLVALADYDELLLIDIDKMTWKTISDKSFEPDIKHMVGQLCVHYKKDYGFRADIWC